MDAGPRLIRETPAGAEIDVRVVPRAKKTAIDGIRGGAVLIRVAAPPVDDAANSAVIEFLADTLGVPRRSVRIVSGQRGRSKRIAVDGVSADQVRSRLTAEG